jgi:hypothetical protein
VQVQANPTLPAPVLGTGTLPLPGAANAVLGSPLALAQPLLPGAEVLLSTSLPVNEPSALSVAGVGVPAVHGASVLDLASRLGPGFLAAAHTAVSATATLTQPVSVVGPWQGARYRLTVGAGLEGLTVGLDVVSGTLAVATSGGPPLQSADAVTVATRLLATLHLAHDNLSPLAQTTNGATGNIAVTLEQTIGGLPILGPAAATVVVDAQGRLVSLRCAFVVTNGGQGFPLRNSVQALDDLMGGAGLYSGPTLSLAAPLEVQAISLAYAGVQANAPSGNVYLEPVYVFSGTVHTADGSQAFTAYVPAVVASVLAG